MEKFPVAKATATVLFGIVARPSSKIMNARSRVRLGAVLIAWGVLSSHPALALDLWPRLSANIFDDIIYSQSSYDALAAFDVIIRPAVFSSGCDGGFDYGVRTGFGSYANDVYDLSCNSNGNQEPVYESKLRNPDIRWIAHASLRKVEAAHFSAGKSWPKRWFVDQLSPKWFAYTPLITLQADQHDKNAVTFQFDPTDLARYRDVYHAHGTPGSWPGGDKFQWHYLAFYDNDAGGGRGTVEIMAIEDIDVVNGVITVARKANLARNVYGRRQTYSAGHRAGILSHSAESFGSFTFLMNPTTSCERVSADPSDPNAPQINWAEALRRDLIEAFYLPASYPAGGTPLCDGILMDADEEDAQQIFGFTMAAPDNFHVDFDLDGTVDGDLDGDGNVDDFSIPTAMLVAGYKAYEAGIRADADAAGRTDFLILKNGVISDFPRDLNGRRYEDWDDPGFQDPDIEAATQNYLDIETPGNVHQPPLVIINERDRSAQDFFNPERHRMTMAMAYIFGQGYYGHTGRHATRHREILGNQEPDGLDDWLDEMSVDPAGVGCNHPAYSGTTRWQYHDWMGAPLGPFVELDAATRTYRRDFENAVAVFSGYPTTIELGTLFRKILGTDDPTFNDGSELRSIEFTTSQSGAILVRTAPLSALCPPQPEPGCLGGGSASFSLRDKTSDKGDRLKWVLRKGDAFSQADLGSPEQTTTYVACLYDYIGGSPTLALSLRIDPGIDWHNRDPKGYRYKDHAGAEDGVRSLNIDTGAFRRSRVRLKARGVQLPMPGPAEATRFFHDDPQLTVQLTAVDAGTCWSTTFTDARRNTADRFKTRF